MRTASASTAFRTAVLCAAALVPFPVRPARGGTASVPPRAALAVRQAHDALKTSGVLSSSKGADEAAQEARIGALRQAQGLRRAQSSCAPSTSRGAEGTGSQSGTGGAGRKLPGRQARAVLGTPGSLWGRIVVEAAGRRRVIPVGEARSGVKVAGSRDLLGRIVLRRVRPLWERADGSPIAEHPAYRGREFTTSGQLVGRPLDITLRFELMVEVPRTLRGMLVRVEIDELTVTTHRYRTSWGRVKSVDKRPVELGHLPSRALTLRTGRVSGPRVIEFERGGTYSSQPERADVVRLAGYAFGLRCRYRIAVEGFDEGERPVALASAR